MHIIKYVHYIIIFQILLEKEMYYLIFDYYIMYIMKPDIRN